MNIVRLLLRRKRVFTFTTNHQTVMQDLENRYIKINVFEEAEPKAPKAPKKPREPIGPRIKDLLEEGTAFGASVVEALKESAEENRAKVAMVQRQRRAERKKKWDEFCNQFSAGKHSDAETISEEMIRDFFNDLGFGKKRRRA